jgi:hypothetical protein
MRAVIAGLGLLAIVACSSDPTRPTETAVAIRIDIPQLVLRVGESTQATAVGLDANARVIPGAQVKWSSSNPSVATITAGGLITAVAAGQVSVRGVIGTVTGSVDLIVDATGCATSVSLAVGEVRVLNGPTQVKCITIGGTAPSDYLVVTANAGTTLDESQQYVVSAWPAGTTASDVTVGRPGVASADVPLPNAISIEAAVRAAERRVIRSQLARAVAPRPLQRAALRVSDPPRLGDTLTYRVADVLTTDPCSRYQSVRATVKAVGNKALIVQDVAAPADGFSTSDFAAIAAEFDQLVLPTDMRWFGAPTDVNGDGHITILYTPAVNRLTPPGSRSYVGGYFFGVDLFARVIPSDNWRCDASNEQEIFFMLAPDPTGTINGNTHTVSSVRSATRGTIAHELQHMINQGVRQSDARVDSLEVAWLDEGLAHFAEEVVGRAKIGKGDLTRLSMADITGDRDDYDAFFWPNLIRLRTWMRRPDLASALSSRVDADLAPRGAAWALVRHLADVYGGADPAAFVRRIVAGPEVGVRNIEARSGKPFGEILPGFLIAMYDQQTPSGPVDPGYRFAGWSLRDVMTELNSGTFPLLTDTLPGDARVQSPAGSGNFFLVRRPAGGALVSLRMISATGTAVEFDAGMYVMRVR